MSTTKRSSLARLVEALKRSPVRVYHVVVVPDLEEFEEALGVEGSTEDGQGEISDADGIWRKQVTTAGAVFNLIRMPETSTIS